MDDTITYCLINEYKKDVDAFLNDFSGVLERLYQLKDQPRPTWDCLQ